MKPLVIKLLIFFPDLSKLVMMKNNFLTQLLGVKRHIYEKYLKNKAKKKNHGCFKWLSGRRRVNRQTYIDRYSLIIKGMFTSPG